MTIRNVLIGLAISGTIGLAIFGVMLSRVTTVSRVGDAETGERFETVRDQFEDPSPRLTFDEQGDLVWRTPARGEVEDISNLHVMAYRGPAEGLVQVAIPMWFLRLKEPAVRFALRRTGVDLVELGLSSRRLRAYGPAVIFHEEYPNGDVVLIWTEAGTR